MCMEELELTEAQAKALLDSPTPLADVYREFEKLETGYMDVIRDTIDHADEVCREPEELNPQSVYLHSAAYASEHGETDAYWMSDQANFSCKAAIEQAISRHYLPLEYRCCGAGSLGAIRAERMNLSLPTRFDKEADGRISREVKHGQRPFLCRRTEKLPANVPT